MLDILYQISNIHRLIGISQTEGNNLPVGKALYPNVTLVITFSPLRYFNSTCYNSLNNTLTIFPLTNTERKL